MGMDIEVTLTDDSINKLLDTIYEEGTKYDERNYAVYDFNDPENLWLKAKYAVEQPERLLGNEYHLYFYVGCIIVHNVTDSIIYSAVAD